MKNNMKIRLFGTIQKCVLTCSLTLMLFACNNDAWDDHYQAALQEKSTETLWEQLQKQDSLSQFRHVLENVRVTNGNKFTSITYASLLGKQYFTVFAPVNGTFDSDSLIAECETLLGNKRVEQMFVNSHLSRTPYSLSSNTNLKALMMNGKYLQFVDSTLADVKILENSNIIAKNGLIHSVKSTIPYLRNIYEVLVEDPQFSGLGNYLFKGQKDSLDEVNSIEGGINEDGVTVYVDSVFIRKNDLLGKFGWINSEDSTYWVVAPTQSGWDSAYKKVSSYFEYRNVVGADSLKKYWTQYNLMKDLFFNPKLQKAPNDSLTSNQYSIWNPEMHVFYNPKSDGGILEGYDSIKTSNGLIFRTPEWNYDVEDVFFEPITVQAENRNQIVPVNQKDFSTFQRYNYADSISGGGYLEIRPVATKQTDVTFKIPNTLSGKYDICVVLLPKTVYNAASTDTLRNKFTSVVTYNKLDNSEGKVTCRGKEGENKSFFISNPYEVDTITLTTLALPTCNYNQRNSTVTVRLTSVAIRTANDRKLYTHQFYIDCFYLKPRQD